jgi:uncharacterized membrane protein YhhN
MLTTLLPVVSILVLVSAALTLAGHYLHPPRPLLILLFKPLTTILILVVALLPGTLQSSAYARLIAAGLIFSLVGDVLLVLPDRFLHGLGAFLLAQVAYILAFRGGAQAQGFAVVALVLAAVAGGMLWYLWPTLGAHLKAPVTVYVVIIALMAALAVGRWLAQPSTSALLAAAGALLFMGSDATLAVNRFRQPFRLAELVVLVTYFAAQWLIARSV